MVNPFRTALQQGLAVVENFASELVIYSRGPASVEIRATRGDKSATETDTGQQSVVQGVRVDWIVRDEHINRTDGPIVPIMGDKITDSNGVAYRVTNHPGDGKPARWMEHRLAIRIHTIVVEGE